MSKDYYNYRAELAEVVDGDTVDLTVDLGFHTYKNIRVRLQGVDTNEIFGVRKESTEYKRGMKQKEFVEEFLNVEQEWGLEFVSAEESGKYGRWIGDIHVSDKSLTQALCEEWPDVKQNTY